MLEGDGRLQHSLGPGVLANLFPVLSGKKATRGAQIIASDISLRTR